MKAMGRQMNGVCKNIFPQFRPNATDESLMEFIVVSLPYSEVNRTMGENDDYWRDLTVVYEIFVADKKTARNPKQIDDDKMKELRLEVEKRFPLVDKTLGIKIVRPRTVIPASSDGNGYHYTRIQAKMTTLV